MTPLPDPRQSHSLSNRAQNRRGAGRIDSPASQHRSASGRLQTVLQLLKEDREPELRRLIARAESATERRNWLDAVDAGLLGADRPGVAQVRIFAIPVVLICAGEAGTTIPAVLTDVSALHRLLLAGGAVGSASTLALSNALTTAQCIEAVTWTTLYRFAMGEGPVDLSGLALPPEPVVLCSDREQVDLRFLTGAAVTGAGAPAFAETAHAIGQWGMAFTRALAGQLAVPGATLLPIARPAMSLPRAVVAGRFARTELDFQLCMSNAVRRARTRFGEPDVTVAACADHSIRVRLGSKLDPAFLEECRWVLDPADDLGSVTDSIFGLLAEMRLDRVTVLNAVQPAAAQG